MTETKLLFARLDKLTYPETMIGVRGGVPRRAFFPGGKGTFDNSETISDKNIMILGQDFDCERGYKITLSIGEEDIRKIPTWRNIISLLKQTGINENNCFFTNAIMGIRRGNSITGKSPAFKCKTFIQDCQEFFFYQIEVQKPKVIFVLGLRVAEFLAETSSQLKSWANIKSYKDIDSRENPIKKDIVFTNGIKSNLVLLMHPSCRKYNLDKREYKGETGENAQIKMIQEVL